MTYYLRIGTGVKLSDSSNYEFPLLSNSFLEDYETSEATKWVVMEQAVTSGTAVSLSVSNFTTIVGIVVQNMDDSVGGVFSHYGLIGSATYASLAWSAADTDRESIVDNATGGTFVTNGANEGGYVRATNTEDATNTNTFLIQAVNSTSSMTLSYPSTVVTNALDTGADTTGVVLTFLSLNRMPVAAGQVVMCGDTDPENAIYLQSLSGTISFRVFVYGT